MGKQYFKELGNKKIKGRSKYSKKHINKVDAILYYSEPIVLKTKKTKEH